MLPRHQLRRGAFHSHTCESRGDATCRRSTDARVATLLYASVRKPIRSSITSSLLSATNFLSLRVPWNAFGCYVFPVCACTITLHPLNRMLNDEGIWSFGSAPQNQFSVSIVYTSSYATRSRTSNLNTQGLKKFNERYSQKVKFVWIELQIYVRGEAASHKCRCEVSLICIKIVELHLHLPFSFRGRNSRILKCYE